MQWFGSIFAICGLFKYFLFFSWNHNNLVYLGQQPHLPYLTAALKACHHMLHVFGCKKEKKKKIVFRDTVGQQHSGWWEEKGHMV